MVLTFSPKISLFWNNCLAEVLDNKSEGKKKPKTKPLLLAFFNQNFALLRF